MLVLTRQGPGCFRSYVADRPFRARGWLTKVDCIRSIRSPDLPEASQGHLGCECFPASVAHAMPDPIQFISAHGYIDQGVIDAGYLEGTKNPNITLSAECNGRSMIGGVCELQVQELWPD